MSGASDRCQREPQRVLQLYQLLVRLAGLWPRLSDLPGRWPWLRRTPGLLVLQKLVDTR